MALPVNRRYAPTYVGLGLLLLLTLACSVRYGAVDIRPGELWSALEKSGSGPASLSLNERILLQIRLPRALLCLAVGGALGMGGVLLQGLFRNPIVEPGLIGTSSGAAFGAALYFVLGASWKLNTGAWTLPLASCAGGMLATFLVIALATPRAAARTGIVALLLTGMAVNALFLSGVGFLSYTARDPQARSITFWNLGTLSGASWQAVIIVGLTTIVCMMLALRLSKGLNALMMGTDEAAMLGVHVKRLKLSVLLVNVVLVAVATSFTGVISFVGLIVPHLMRLLKGSDHRYLLIGSALSGAILLNVADIAARLLLRPAELPIGIVTSVVGVPVFLILLKRNNQHF